VGRRLVKPILRAQAMVLRKLWIKHGGPCMVSRMCGVGIQEPSNWRTRGRVPLKLCRRVAEALGESIWALNYADMALLVPKEKRPSWISVVDACGFDKQTRNEIIFLEAPYERD